MGIELYELFDKCIILDEVMRQKYTLPLINDTQEVKEEKINQKLFCETIDNIREVK